MPLDRTFKPGVLEGDTSCYYAVVPKYTCDYHLIPKEKFLKVREDPVNCYSGYVN